MLPDPVRQALALNDSLPNLWPEFVPGAYPVALFDGASTWLVRHPQPPPEFVPAGEPGLFVMTGRHPQVLANYAAEIGGKITVSILCGDNAWPPPAGLAALIAHEAFHAFQIERAQHWFPNMLDLYGYPFGDAEALAWRRLETAALRRALDANDQADIDAWAAGALAYRSRRFALMPEMAARYEQKNELVEGLAHFVEWTCGRHLGVEPHEPILEPAYGPHEMRARGYRSGCAWAILLAELDATWMKRLMVETSASLDTRLATVLAELDVQPRAFNADVERGATEQAAVDVRAWRAEQARLRAEYLARPGWRLRLVAGTAPLRFKGGDPSNVQFIGEGELLHTRYLAIGNQYGEAELLDQRALSTGAGAGSVADGLREVLIAGLSEAPQLVLGPDGTQIRFEGGTARFKGAARRLEGELRFEIGATAQ